MENLVNVYVLLDQREEGEFKLGSLTFPYRPFYASMKSHAKLPKLVSPNMFKSFRDMNESQKDRIASMLAENQAVSVITIHQNISHSNGTEIINKLREAIDNIEPFSVQVSEEPEKEVEVEYSEGSYKTMKGLAAYDQETKALVNSFITAKDAKEWSNSKIVLKNLSTEEPTLIDNYYWLKVDGVLKESI